VTRVINEDLAPEHRVFIVEMDAYAPGEIAAISDLVHPKVAIMNNGAKKGGSTPTFETLAKTPGLEALWQLHFSNEAGMHNMAEEYIANPMGQNDAANYLKLTVNPKGGFSVFNSRTKATKDYAAR